MFNNILVVCIGNICRSPMAEALLRHELAAAGRAGVHLSSAGLGALVGHPADATARALMLERGIDLSAHRARQITAQLCGDADLILVMDNAMRSELAYIDPAARGKVYRLGEWTGSEIRDPYRQPEAVFRSVLQDIDAAVRSWTRRLV